MRNVLTLFVALIWYEYALTFSMEVEYIWRTKFQLSTVLYILCQYARVANVLYLLSIGGKLAGKVRSLQT